MNIDVSKIVTDKLAQLDADGVIQRKIEETVEKTVMDAITSELSSYTFRNGISKQVSESVSKLAADCGFSAYNGFIADTVKRVVQELYSADIAEKVKTALTSVLLQKHECVSLSLIFSAYREWVLANTDEAEKHEHGEFTADLEVSVSGGFTHYVCRFADRPLKDGYLGGKERGEVEVRFCVFGEKKKDNISSVYLNGHDLKNTLKIGTLTTFEAFVSNLYYNGTEVELDTSNVYADNDTSFDVDI